MGHHYVPQRYLRGFQDSGSPGWIWMYDKLQGTRKLLPIKQVAQGPGFYTDAVEDLLNERVEKPGNAVIDKLRRGESIDEGDRARLAYYVGTMIRRVPYARGKAHEMAPKVLTEVAREIRERFEEEARQGRIDLATLEARLAESDAAEEKLRKQSPPEVIELIETPWPMQSMLAAIFHMTWRLLPSEGPSYFLTSDNPAYFFGAYGLGTPNSELVFPLCSDLALHCSWQGSGGAWLLGASQKLVKEVNRRIACGADRFVFYHREEDWVLGVAQNRVEQLSRIQW